MIIIPTDDRPFNEQAIQLGDQTFILFLRWSTRASAWYLDLSDVDGDPIVQNVKVVCNYPLLKKVADERKPAGELFALTFTEDTSPPGLAELGPDQRVALWYFSDEELGR